MNITNILSIIFIVIIFVIALNLLFQTQGIDLSSNVSALLEGRAEGVFSNPMYVTVLLIVISLIITSIILLKFGA